MMRTLSVLLAAAAIAGCSSPTGAESDIISARVESRTITITNVSDDPVYYFAADREALALIDWIPCTDPPRCNAVPAHSSKAIAFEEIAAYQEGSGSAVIYHWKLKSNGSGAFQPDSIRQVIVPLK